MGFMFRVEQLTVTEENTVLTGHMISGALDWQQLVEIQVEEDMKTVFTASLCGVDSTEHAGFTLMDPASLENVLALPLSMDREKRIGLILAGTPPSSELPVPAIAVGVDSPAPTSASGMQTAFQSAMPVLGAAHGGVLVREYPYRISRQGMLYFAPWTLFGLTVVLSGVYVAGLFNGLPLQRFNFEDWSYAACLVFLTSSFCICPSRCCWQNLRGLSSRRRESWCRW
jgi:hypothetical protein